MYRSPPCIWECDPEDPSNRVKTERHLRTIRDPYAAGGTERVRKQIRLDFTFSEKNVSGAKRQCHSSALGVCLYSVRGVLDGRLSVMGGC